MTFRPRFSLILLGIAVAGGGGWCFTQGQPAAGVLGFAAGLAVVAAEFVPTERKREADAARQQRDLAAKQKQIATDAIDDEWARRSVAGVEEKE